MTATWDVPGAVGSGGGSIIGRFAIELLVVTKIARMGSAAGVILTGRFPRKIRAGWSDPACPGRIAGQALNPIVGLGSQLTMPDHWCQ